jgi:beta-glucosidase
VNNPEVQLGNYNGFPPKSITPLLGLQEKWPDVEIIQGLNCDLIDRHLITPIEHAVTLPDGSGEGYAVAFYNNMELQGEPVYTGTTEKIFFTSKEARQLLPGQHADELAFAPGVPLSNFTSRFEGVFESPVSGPVEFKVTYDDGYRLYIDGKVISERWDLRRGDWICPFEAQKGRKYALKLEHVQRGNHAKIQLDIQTRSLADFQPDMEKIKAADVIVFVGGLSPRVEGEEMTVSLPGFAGGDRTSILLPELQIELLKKLKALDKPVVLVLMSGGALALPEMDGIDAIVQAWYGGEFAGNAMADVLFGDYNPSGHLPITFYTSDADLPDFEDYSMTNRTYKYFTGKALYPFGYGLSYTNFSYEWAKQPKKVYKPEETLQCSVTIKNTGKRDGDAVGQVYIKYPDGKGFPLKELRAFERKTIVQGQSHQMQVSIPLEELAKWDEAAGKLLVPTGKYGIFVGSHSSDEAVIADFEIKYF